MSEYWYIEEANYRLYCLLCPIPISSLTWKNLAENLGIKRTLLTSLSMSILICTHQNLCVVEPLLLLFQFCNLGNGRDSLGSKTSDSVRQHWWGSDVWVMWVDFQLVSDFLLDLPWQLSTTDGVKHIISLQGSQTTIEFSLFMFNPAKKVSVDWL